MVKLKQTKKMNLAELIQYIIDNDIKDRIFTNQDNDEVVVSIKGEISISYNRHVGCYCDSTVESVRPTSVFEVNTEEEITEETEVPLLLEVMSLSNSDKVHIELWKDTSINNIKDYSTISIRLVKSDGSTTLLWKREGGLQ